MSFLIGVFVFDSEMPAPAPAENGAPRTELQELQLKATQVTDEVSKVNTLHQIERI